jgi:hypothetical protein
MGATSCIPTLDLCRLRVVEVSETLSPDHKLERLFSLKGVRRYWGDFGMWTGLVPDDSPLLARDTSSQEIYALDWQAP